MGNRYLIVSDLHLCDVEEHDDGWKAFKSSRYLIDHSFGELLEEFASETGPGVSCTLVLNGDIFDFDLVTAVPAEPEWQVSFSERRRGLDPTEIKTIWKLGRVLDHHPGFVDALAAFLARGHKLVYVMGNHDREFHFGGVQQSFVAALQAKIGPAASPLPEDAVRFEPWFYLVSGELYVEHGQQYDLYSSFRYVLSPVIEKKGEQRIALPMGNLSNRYLMSHMGYFNPHDSDYILNVFSYAYHWLKHYAFSRRSLFFNWLWGSLVVLGKLLANKRRLLRRHPDQNLLHRQQAERYGIEAEDVERLHKLWETPITNRLFRIMREFWLDRLLIAFFMTGGTIALALVPIPLWIKLMVPLSSFPLLYFIYEWAVQGESIFTIEQRLPARARDIANLLPVKVITFGHTHVPRLLPLSKNVTFVDTGTWAPIPQKGQPDTLAPGYRNYLIISFEGDRPCLRFDSWL
jgi:UDP-2,3-diacylglucosamine pyrophosphatase LpxH